MSNNVYQFPVVVSQEELDHRAEAKKIIEDLKTAYLVAKVCMWTSIIAVLMMLVVGIANAHPTPQPRPADLVEQHTKRAVANYFINRFGPAPSSITQMMGARD